MSDAQPIAAPDHGHAMLSASGSERWELCPGSVAMEHGLPDMASEFADEGTSAHTLATLTFADPEHRAHAFLGRHIQVTDADGKLRRSFIVDHDMADYVQTFVNDTLLAVGDGTLLVEQRVPLTQITDEVDATGQADVIGISSDGEEITVRDLKYGMDVKVYVKPDGHLNPQLVMYADGAVAKFNGLSGDCKRVRLTVQQPRLGHTDEVVVSLDELRARVKALRKAADTATTAFTFRDNWMGKTENDRQYLVPGEAQCRFCKAKATCPKLTEYVNETSGADFKPIITDGLNDMAPDIHHGMPPETLSQKMYTVGLVEDWCKAVRAEVKRRLGNGIDVPDYKLVQGKRGNRQWIDDTDAEAALKAMRLKSDVMYVQKLQSPTQIEKALKANPRKWKKIAPLIAQSDGKLHVAHISDPREAVIVGPVADDFAPITEQLPIPQEVAADIGADLT